MPTPGGRNTRLSSRSKRRQPSLKKGARNALNLGKKFANFMSALHRLQQGNDQYNIKCSKNLTVRYRLSKFYVGNILICGTTNHYLCFII